MRSYLKGYIKAKTTEWGTSVTFTLFPFDGDEQLVFIPHARHGNISSRFNSIGNFASIIKTDHFGTQHTISGLEAAAEAFGWIDYWRHPLN
jgi:hypothetical protein